MTQVGVLLVLLSDTLVTAHDGAVTERSAWLSLADIFRAVYLPYSDMNKLCWKVVAGKW